MDCVKNILKNAGGQSVSDQKDILLIQISYFADLYKQSKWCKQVGKKNPFMKNTSIPCISEGQRERCEGILTEIEILNGLKQMRNGAAPSSDGVTVEFLKVFWSHLRKLVTASFNSAFENGHMSAAQCEAVITLIHKHNTTRLCWPLLFSFSIILPSDVIKPRRVGRPHGLPFTCWGCCG